MELSILPKDDTYTGIKPTCFQFEDDDYLTATVALNKYFTDCAMYGSKYRCVIVIRSALKMMIESMKPPESRRKMCVSTTLFQNLCFSYLNLSKGHLKIDALALAHGFAFIISCIVSPPCYCDNPSRIRIPSLHTD